MIQIERLEAKALSSLKLEIVERKGLGHPDTICDLIAEDISRALTKKYLSKTGYVLHHNIDKILLSAGKTEKKFGGGRFLKPIRLFIGDRATYKYKDAEIPIGSIVKSAIAGWFKKHIRYLSPKDIETNILLLEGSEELTGIFQKRKAILAANDTSVGIGYYPFSKLENITYLLETYLNSRDFKNRYPFTGEDIKVMAVRDRKNLQVTVAMPLIAKFVKDEDAYFRLKERAYSEINGFLRKNWDEGKIKVIFNALDKRGAGINGVYLTISGTSAEDADSGEVGRGNRANGLISFMRPLGSEAVAGKNPISHVGKIYNLFAFYLAEKIYKKFEGILEVYIYILSRIGSPIDKPDYLSVKIIPDDVGFKKVNLLSIKDYSAKELNQIGRFCQKIIKGKIGIR